MKIIRTVLCINAVALCSFPQWASAASFQILEQSPAQLGKSFAGTASDARDATTVFFNPAAMSQLESSAVSGAVNIINTDAEFSDNGSNTTGVNDATQETAAVPNLYGVSKLSQRWSIGYGINAPYGLASSFEPNWFGRYLATDSELEVINLNINSSFQLTEQWSFGFGINYQRTTVTLENSVDSTFGAATAIERDSSVKIKGDDTDYVADLSIFWKPSDVLALGLVWRQGGSFDLEGQAQFNLSDFCMATPACANGLSALAGDIGASVDLPDTTTLSGSFALNEQWSIHADLAHTAWGSIQEVAIVNSGNGATLNTLELFYDDTMRYSLGATYATGGAWMWRVGVTLDEAPQTDSQYVTPRIPDEDRTWLSAGFNYQWTESLSLDAAYTHIMVGDAQVNNVDAMGHQVVGSFDSSVDILGVQLNWMY